MLRFLKAFRGTKSFKHYCDKLDPSTNPDYDKFYPPSSSTPSGKGGQNSDSGTSFTDTLQSVLDESSPAPAPHPNHSYQS